MIILMMKLLEKSMTISKTKGFLFSVEKFFSKEIIQFSNRRFSFLFLKLPMTRRLFFRAVRTLINTKMWASSRLESQKCWVRIPLSTIIFKYF